MMNANKAKKEGRLIAGVVGAVLVVAILAILVLPRTEYFKGMIGDVKTVKVVEDQLPEKEVLETIVTEKVEIVDKLDTDVKEAVPEVDTKVVLPDIQDPLEPPRIDVGILGSFPLPTPDPVTGEISHTGTNIYSDRILPAVADPVLGFQLTGRGGDGSRAYVVEYDVSYDGCVGTPNLNPMSPAELYYWDLYMVPVTTRLIARDDNFNGKFTEDEFAANGLMDFGANELRRFLIRMNTVPHCEAGDSLVVSIAGLTWEDEHGYKTHSSDVAEWLNMTTEVTRNLYDEEQKDYIIGKVPVQTVFYK